MSLFADKKRLQQLENREKLFLKVLGWEDFCDCGVWEPYTHTHHLCQGLERVDKFCECGQPMKFDNAMIGHRLSREKQDMVQFREYKCESCFLINEITLTARDAIEYKDVNRQFNMEQ